MKSHEINHFYWPIVIQSIFDWTFNLNEDFAKGKHMAYKLPVLQYSSSLVHSNCA